MSVVALAVSGCNIFGNDDDDDDDGIVVIYKASLASRSADGYSLIPTSTVSKAIFSSYDIFEGALKLKNESKEAKNGITCTATLYKGDTKLYDLVSNKNVGTIGSGKIYPSDENAYLTSRTWSSSIKNIPDYENGDYKMVIELNNGQKKEIKFTITD